MAVQFGYGIRVNVKSEDDLHPGCLQASACSTATGEEIEDFDLHRSFDSMDKICISLILRGIDLYLQVSLSECGRVKRQMHAKGGARSGPPLILGGNSLPHWQPYGVPSPDTESWSGRAVCPSASCL